MDDKKCNFASVRRTAEIYSGALNQASIRWLIFNNKNGFNEKCVRRVGRKILIHLPSLEDYLCSSLYVEK